MDHLKNYFEKKPVIPSIRAPRYIKKAMETDAVMVFLLSGSIFDLEETMALARQNDKLLIINVDLIDGIGQDKKGIEYLAENNLCDGIISTKSYLIDAAVKAGLMTIQRFFMLDSGSLKTARYQIKKHQPDAVEILPAVTAPYFIEKVNNLNSSIVAGGLVNTREEVLNLISQGVLAISTSNQQLWQSNIRKDS